MEDRKRLVEELKYYTDPNRLPQIMKALAQHPWDSEPLVTLSMQDVCSILERYLDGKLTAKNVHDWADAVEVRDDIECGSEELDREAVAQIIMRLAMPELEGSLTKERAESVVSVLSGEDIPTAEEVDDAYASNTG
jgi:hypothetical protein